MKNVLMAALLTVSFITSAHADESTKDPKKISFFLAKIPVTDKTLNYKNLGERLPNLGMTVQYVKFGNIAKGEDEPPYFLAGDEVIDIFLTEPNQIVKAICPISGGRASYIIRGKKIIPQTRTAYWLMANRCDFKG
ncbi:hypothetical protein IGS61_04560 [Janthinobacterium sp. FW305-129]|uniref:hypothetical protein n=1 Tax=Janthinobacterium sp. FW305-129 TaxID=2775054 RepID=UPI001E3815D4|nr:hypothetical protein [Janthinobacterium sp. FW305-129]MCC7596745.1 hypothetical protein [Janthinobacterium sp. FW305-129]